VTNAYNTLVGKAEGKRLLVRHKCRWKGDVKFDLNDAMWGDVHWIHLT
jgi:hypothetical protein